jgi:hypothetical protein
MNRLRLSRRTVAITASLLAHAALLGVLMVWYLPRATPVASSAQKTSDGEGPIDDQSNESSSPTKQRSAPTESPDVPAEQIGQSIESQLEQVSKLSDEQKRSELEKNLKRLDAIAQEDSVEQVSVTIAESLGLDSTQYTDKQPPADGSFDHDTAQLADVKRSQDASGRWVYETVMVDATGRTMIVPTPAEQGEQLYETFRKMKQYPMARTIYQSVVMPMMQTMLEAEQAGRGLKRKAERAEGKTGKRQQDSPAAAETTTPVAPR